MRDSRNESRSGASMSREGIYSRPAGGGDYGRSLWSGGALAGGVPVPVAAPTVPPSCCAVLSTVLSAPFTLESSVVPVDCVALPTAPPRLSTAPPTPLTVWSIVPPAPLPAPPTTPPTVPPAAPPPLAAAPPIAAPAPSSGLPEPARPAPASPPCAGPVPGTPAC